MESAVLSAKERHQIRRLQVQAWRRVDNLFAGSYRSAFRGRGMEFQEVRPYVPGDDVRNLDWNVTARTGEPFVKEFQEERQLTVLVAMDVSGSLGFGSGGLDGITDKAMQQARVGAALAHAATKNRDRVGLLTFDEQVRTYIPPRAGRVHTWSVIRSVFTHGTVGRGTDMVHVADFLGKVLRRRTVLCLVSDFIDDGDWDRALGVLAQRHGIHVFLVFDPLEETLPPAGLMQMEDAETRRSQVFDFRSTRVVQPVQQRLERLRRIGVRASAISTEYDAFSALVSHFERLERRP